MVRRHVRQSVKHLANQRVLIARLREKGLPIEQAEEILASIEDVQRLHEAHLARLEPR